jgi:MFS family permease
MESLTLSPVLVALVETAGSLPVVLAALPAGALADIVDRRRLLIVMQVWMVIVSHLSFLVRPNSTALKPTDSQRRGS